MLWGATFYAISTNLAYIVRTATDGDPVRMSRLLAIGGFAVVFGRFIFGYLLDVMNPALVAVTLFSMCMVFLALDAWGQNYEMLLIAAFISGLVGGGESDLMPYLAGRAFGQRSLSKVLGLFFLAFFMGAAIGPISFAQASQAFGGTTTPLLFLCAMQLVPITIFVRLASRHEFRPDRLKYI